MEIAPMLTNARYSEQCDMIDACQESLFFVEVSPLWFAPTTDLSISSLNQYNEITPMIVKQTLCRKLSSFRNNSSDEDRLTITAWVTSKDGSNNSVCSGSIRQTLNPPWVRLTEEDQVVPVVYIPSEDPTQLESIPCWIVGYSTRESARVSVTDSTLVRILPVTQAFRQGEGSMTPSQRRGMFTGGETREATLSDSLRHQVLACHNPKAIEELSLRLSRLLSSPVLVGTTADAFGWNRKRSLRSRTLQRNLTRDTSFLVEEPPLVDHHPRDGSLTVHSPNHGAGKTVLVKTIAQELGAAVHVIHPGPLLSKYGIHADAALESNLHSIAMSAAVRNVPLCIILDHFDAMLPPSFSGRTAAGDAALPVLNAIAALLKSVTLSIQSKREFPFPSKNPLFNLAGSQGICLSVHLCIIGIVTCQDGRKQRETEPSQRSVLGAMVGGRYRLPDLSASTRLAAFRKVIHDEGLALAKSAEMRLSVFAASTVAIRGAAFGLIAKQLRVIIETKGQDGFVEADDLGLALERFLGGPSNSEVSFMANNVSSPDEERQGTVDLFSSVGGNSDAKSALEEALAMDPLKRTVLHKFGLLPPAGVLLFGPPGTGKTLLAKAVAKLLRSQSGGAYSIGGAFISLQASEIVEAEVGTSEKKLVTAFETARNNAPSVIFFDEFQALFTERRGSGSGKLASTLLQCLDDINRWAAVDIEVGNTLESVNYARNRVVVLGATNTPWMIDKAFLRAGRFDRTVYVGLPSPQDRASILRVHIEKMSLELVDGDRDKTIEMLCSDLAAKTEGFSGADLAALCRAAAVRCLRDSEHGGGYVTLTHFLGAVGEDVAPSSSPALIEQLLNWRP